MRRELVRRISVVLAVVATAVGGVSVPAAASGGGEPGVQAAAVPTAPDLLPTTAPAAMPQRIAGANRFATAAGIAQLFGRSDAVIVANGSSAKGGFDALSANYLAGVHSAPILLTGGTKLEPETAQAVRTVLAGAAHPTIFVLGGVDSVSAAVAASLAAASPGATVTRIAGRSRYATAALIAGAGDGPSSITVGGTSGRTAILASGISNADALAAGPLSYAWRVPILLAGPGATVPEPTLAAIRDLGVEQLLVLGGVDRIPQAAITAATAAGVRSVHRIAGANRYATATELGRQSTTSMTGPDGRHYGRVDAGSRVYLANGVTGFPDALAIGPLAGSNGDALLTVGATSMDARTLARLRTPRVFDAVTALGSAATVSAPVFAAAKYALGINAFDPVWVPKVQADDESYYSDMPYYRDYYAKTKGMTTFEQIVPVVRGYLPWVDKVVSTIQPSTAVSGADMNCFGVGFGGGASTGGCTVTINPGLATNAVVMNYINWGFRSALRELTDLPAGWKAWWPDTKAYRDRTDDALDYLMGWNRIDQELDLRVEDFRAALYLLQHNGIADKLPA